MSQDASYRDMTHRISADLGALRTDVPEVMKAFSELGRSALAEGALDAKTKELIAMAVGVAAHCEGCLAFHAKSLVRLGATRQELDEALGVAVYMGGGPSAMYAASAVAAFDEFARAATPAAA